MTTLTDIMKLLARLDDDYEVKVTADQLELTTFVGESDRLLIVTTNEDELSRFICKLIEVKLLINDEVCKLVAGMNIVLIDSTPHADNYWYEIFMKSKENKQ